VRRGFRLSLALSVANDTGASSAAGHGPRPAHRVRGGGTHPWPAGDRPSSVPSLAPLISTGAARTFPQDLHNSPGGRADRPTPVPGAYDGHSVCRHGPEIAPCRATVLVDEAPAPARSREDPWTTPLTVPIWVDAAQGRGHGYRQTEDGRYPRSGRRQTVASR
jgi:hypothetical protein